MASFDAYPIPQADILLSQLGEASYMSALDLTKGYWQIPLVSEIGKRRPLRPEKASKFIMMPFGLHRAAATFQRLVETVLRP